MQSPQAEGVEEVSETYLIYKLLTFRLILALAFFYRKSCHVGVSRRARQSQEESELVARVKQQIENAQTNVAAEHDKSLARIRPR